MGTEREGQLVGGGGGGMVVGGGEGGEKRETKDGDGNFSFEEDWVLILLLIFEFQRHLHDSWMKVDRSHTFLRKILKKFSHFLVDLKREETVTVLETLMVEKSFIALPCLA